MHNYDNILDAAYLGIDALVSEGITKQDDVLIAGGFTRDLILGQQVKDVDLVIRTTVGLGPHLNKRLSRNGFSKTGGGYGSTQDANGFLVYEREFPHLLTNVQAIISPVITSDFITATFDFGLCMCVTTAMGDTYVSQAFIDDVKNKTITLYIRPTMTTYQIGNAIEHHLPRIKDKYPKHTLKFDYTYAHNPDQSSYEKLLLNKEWDE